MQKTLKRLSGWALIVAAILMIPLVGKAPWTAGDFIFAGVVLFGSATIYELVTRTMNNPKHCIAVGAAVLTVVFLIWGWAVAGP
jgi:hypothetical protein